MLIRNINLFDPDIHKIPEYNYQKFQRCLILDAGIGSDTMSVIGHTDTIMTMAVNDRKEDLSNELNNFRLALYSAIEGISYTSMAFACLIIDIDGVKQSIVTDTDINTLSKLIAETGITHEEIADYVDLLKKKLILS
jgi:hypothetical protein